MTDAEEPSPVGDADRDTDTIADVDHESPEGAADPNAVWERGDERGEDTPGTDEQGR